MAVTGVYCLLFGTIRHGGQIYNDDEKSEPVITKRDEGYGLRIIKQILKGKRRGGWVITESQTIFKHEPNSDRRTTSQKLRPGKKITLTDGTTAEGE